MAFPSKNSRLENNPDWGEKGRRKLRQLQVDTMNAFSETPIGAEILERLEDLEDEVELLSSTSIFKFCGSDQVLDESGESPLTEMALPLNFIAGGSNVFNISGSFLYSPTETNHGISFPFTVAPLASTGWIVVTLKAIGGDTTIAEDTATFSALVSPGSGLMKVDFAGSVTLNGVSTVMTPTITSAGGTLFSGSYIRAHRFV